MNYTLREMEPSDAPRVLEIFQEGIESGLATFETQAPSWESWDMSHHKVCRLILEDQDHEVLGWAALSPVSRRACFNGVAELSVYLDSRAHGKGLGTMLLRQLILSSEEHEFWTLQAGVFPQNLASMRMHQKAGFRLVGTRRRFGKLNGVWADVALFERRSELMDG